MFWHIISWIVGAIVALAVAGIVFLLVVAACNASDRR